MTDKQIEYLKQTRKLTDLQVKAIKVLYGSGKYSMRDLATRYNVSRQTILNVVKGRAYKE